MRKVWVLDTSTKGTGASVVPLEPSPAEPKPEHGTPVAVPKARPRRRERQPATRRPRRFKIVDVVSRQTLAEDARMRATLDALREVRSPVDVRISVWDDEDQSWRLLTLAEQRALWEASRRDYE